MLYVGKILLWTRRPLNLRSRTGSDSAFSGCQYRTQMDKKPSTRGGQKIQRIPVPTLLNLISSKISDYNRKRPLTKFQVTPAKQSKNKQDPRLGPSLTTPLHQPVSTATLTERPSTSATTPTKRPRPRYSPIPPALLSLVSLLSLPSLNIPSHSRQTRQNLHSTQPVCLNTSARYSIPK